LGGLFPHFFYLKDTPRVAQSFTAKSLVFTLLTPACPLVYYVFIALFSPL
jgi:hypothetical protein